MMIVNPVLRGFSPDPSIVRVGDDFYVATSTFEWFPGVRLHHSRDLVHWRQVGCALTRPSQLDLRGVPDSGGVWAPSLSHADGQFWLIYTNVRTCGIGRPFKDLGIFLVTAPSITGPWSEPVALNSIGFDPSLFHDADGRKWLVNMRWDHRKTGVDRFAGIVLQEYDPRVRRLVGPMTKILQKPGVLCEGPNLYRRNGWYYLMLAEGGTGWEHGITMARAREITGPYEPDPQPFVLTARDAPLLPLQKAGHGELVETRAGEWFLAHLASCPLTVDIPASGPNSSPRRERRCILGRETCLQRVRWTSDGWLRLDPDAAPGQALATSKPWHPQLAVPAPRGVVPTPFPASPGRDDFSDTVLPVAWSSLRVPMDESWVWTGARPGWLRLRGRDSLQSLFFQSLVAQPLRTTSCVVGTCLEFEPRAPTEMAGLVCYYDTRTHYYLRVTRDESAGKVLGIVFSDDGAYREPATTDGAGDSGSAERPLQISVNDWPRYFLRASIRDAALQFSASPDGKVWRNLGPVLDASKLSDDYGTALHFTGAMVGLCAQDLAGNGATADFDYFEVEAR